MRLRAIAGTGLLVFASKSAAETIPADHIAWGEAGPPSTLQRRQAPTSSTASTPTSTTVPDGACSNGPFSRTCWSNGYSAATDFDAKWPTTGRTVSYHLELTNSTCDPDGSSARPCQLFNGQYPGPVITANWGDMIEVTFVNKLQTNGTGIHWHGIRQLGSCPEDGVPGITECPLAAGDTKTYRFQATQFGTAWYHSHFSSQYGDGATGSLVINGPASSNYDIDLGPLPLTDWYYQTIWQMSMQSKKNIGSGQRPPNADTILVNGTQFHEAKGTGAYNVVKDLQKGKKYRLRLINTSSDNAIRVSLDNHPFTVITSDLVPIKPFTTEWILLAVGQRYDVIFRANQASGNYWFRANAIAACGSGNSNPSQKAIFSYAGADPVKGANSTAFVEPAGCAEPTTMTPWVKNTVSRDAFISQVRSLEVDLTVAGTTTNGQNIVVWSVNLTAIDVAWEKPTMQYVMDKNTSYPGTSNLIEFPRGDMWSYWIIQEPLNTRVPIPHPIHLHGHDYYVLGQGTGIFNKNTDPDKLVFQNPTRRDTALLPGGGWLALAFPLDNPGVWLMHCHISTHVGEGLGVQFLESKDRMPTGDAAWKHTCSNWNTFQATMPFPKFDSGLKMM